MSDILCITNRGLCRDDFKTRIEAIAQTAPAGILLREKDLSEAEYKLLAAQVLDICKKYQVPCILHSFLSTAIELDCQRIHLPLPLLRRMSPSEKTHFSELGSSCHSVTEAREAEQLGCTYIIAGHIFATDCKKDLAPRGIDFLQEIIQNVTIPVFAIGGIKPQNIHAVRTVGAKGACIMSGLMRCEDAATYMTQLKNDEYRQSSHFVKSL
ncbi:MAG: thiamine phosphate synthase [Lachnospiraceae bacterium]|nr:thiamine phosphate synthase [Lachnospiraceae bacterium]